MSRRQVTCAVSVAMGALWAIGPAVPAAAGARLVPASTTGYLWSTDLAPSSVDAFYAFNSAGGAVSISHGGTGQYLVTFSGLSGILAKPTVSVSTYSALANCDAPMILSSASTLQVSVVCFSFTGSLTDARFDLLAGQAGGAPKGVVDYALVTSPNHMLFSYNSSHKRNSLRHLGAGRYELTLGGPRTTGVTGTVKVSAASFNANCEVAGWHGTAAGEIVDVDCFSAGGSRHDEAFYVGYARRGNLTGLNDATTADAFASRPTTANYRPAIQDHNTPSAHVSVRRLGLGQYEVTFAGSADPLLLNGGDVQVTAVGTRDRHCYVVNWTAVSVQARIGCADNHGHLVDSPFTIQWIVNT